MTFSIIFALRVEKHAPLVHQFKLCTLSFAFTHYFNPCYDNINFHLQYCKHVASFSLSHSVLTFLLRTLFLSQSSLSLPMISCFPKSFFHFSQQLSCAQRSGERPYLCLWLGIDKHTCHLSLQPRVWNQRGTRPTLSARRNMDRHRTDMRW